MNARDRRAACPAAANRAEARINERLSERMGRLENELAKVRKGLVEVKGKPIFAKGYILRHNDSTPE